MSVNFGFSVGDFIAVGKLAYQIVMALTDSSHIQGEIDNLTERLERLLELFNHIRTVTELKVSGQNFMNAAVSNAIGLHLGNFREILETFEAKFIKNAQIFEGEGTGTDSRKSSESRRRLSFNCSIFRDKPKRVYRTITWCICGSDDADILEKSLRTQLMAIQHYLSLAACEGISRNENRLLALDRRAANIEQSTKRVEDKADKILKRLERGDTSSPPVYSGKKEETVSVEIKYSTTYLRNSRNSTQNIMPATTSSAISYA